MTTRSWCYGEVIDIVAAPGGVRLANLRAPGRRTPQCLPARECLTAAELVAFHLGDLPEAELAALAAHLETCRRCEEAAGALDGLSDPTLAAYRQSALAGPLPDAEALPESVGDYEILGEVGRGGMGVVYKARHLPAGPRGGAEDAPGRLLRRPRRAAPRFRIEAEAVARLQHPNIVQLFEVGEHDVGAGPPRPYFTLEFVEGGSLAAAWPAGRCRRSRPPPGSSRWPAPSTTPTSSGIIHRDLKPSNVLLTDDGRPKVCDFGVAKLLTGSDCQTASGMILGTAEYMAPEQAEGKGTPGPASRRLRPGGDPLRDADRPAAVQGGDHAGHAGPAPHAGAGAGRGACSRGARATWKPSA